MNTESHNHLDWKRPPKSPSPTYTNRTFLPYLNIKGFSLAFYNLLLQCVKNYEIAKCKKKKNEEELSSSPLATCVIILSEDT